jgi:hypothetical protein
MRRCTSLGTRISVPQVRRWNFTLPRRIHPCICGAISKTYGEMRRHRNSCKEWQDRPDPRGQSILRRKASKQARPEDIPCPVCGGHRGRHEDACPHDLGEAARLEALLRNGLDPRFFKVFLRYLARCYETETLG